MISLVLENNALGIVCFPGDRSGAFEAPIFGLVLIDTFRYRCGIINDEKPDIRAWQHQSAEGDRL
jgi:hypothetical protein